MTKRSYDISPLGIWTRDRGLCGLCGLPVPPMRSWPEDVLIGCGWFKRGERKPAAPHQLQATRDHVEPRRECGSDRSHNLRLAHRCCNTSRDYKRPEQMREQVLFIARAQIHRDWLRRHGMDDATASLPPAGRNDLAGA